MEEEEEEHSEEQDIQTRLKDLMLETRRKISLQQNVENIVEGSEDEFRHSSSDEFKAEFDGPPAPVAQPHAPY